jgi:peptide-methionine (S)-S-oxide reductase
MKTFLKQLTFLTLVLGISNGCNSQSKPAKNMENAVKSKNPVAEPVPAGKEVATFGTGCFWCTEAVFQNLEGVEKVVSGYSGGTVENPTYKEVCTGETGHAECLQITFDPKKISYEELLEVFWNTHDPTTLNRQGNDVGTQYRSAIFYHNPEQQKLAEAYKQQLTTQHTFKDPIVTEIVPFKIFYAAEDYHQNYFNNHPDQPYCAFVIRPKVDKFKKHFGEKLKKGN